MMFTLTQPSLFHFDIVELVFKQMTFSPVKAEIRNTL
jgi:hypothetical protein